MTEEFYNRPSKVQEVEDLIYRFVMAQDEKFYGLDTAFNMGTGRVDLELRWRGFNRMTTSERMSKLYDFIQKDPALKYVGQMRCEGME